MEAYLCLDVRKVELSEETVILILLETSKLS